MSFKVLTIFCLMCKSCRWIQSTGGATQMYKESVEAFRITRSKLTRIRVRPRDTFKNLSYKNWSFWIQLSSSKLCLYLDPTFPKDNQTAQHSWKKCFSFRQRKSRELNLSVRNHMIFRKKHWFFHKITVLSWKFSGKGYWLPFSFREIVIFLDLTVSKCCTAAMIFQLWQLWAQVQEMWLCV